MDMDPFRELASMLEARISTQAGQALEGVPAEMGTITATGLKLDNFKHEIQDYLVADWLVKVHFPAFELKGTVEGLKDGEGREITGTGTFSFQATEIEEVRLNWKEGMLPGERVLAIPTNSGQEAVVICRVVS